MLKDNMIVPIKMGDDPTADLIADLIECLLDPDIDEPYITDGHLAHQLNPVDVIDR